MLGRSGWSGKGDELRPVVSAEVSAYGSKTVKPAFKVTRAGRGAGPLLWALCFQFFVCEQLARLHVLGRYSMVRNVISDLGAVHPFGIALREISRSAWYLLMDASFSLQGLLIVGGALRLRVLFFSAGGLGRAAWALFLLAGAALFVVGLAPEDVYPGTHVAAAIVHFLAGSLAMLSLGVALLRASRWRRSAGVLTCASGAIALAATVLLGFRNTAWWDQLGLQPGVVERIAAYPLPVWLTLAGLTLLVRERETA